MFLRLELDVEVEVLGQRTARDARQVAALAQLLDAVADPARDGHGAVSAILHVAPGAVVDPAGPAIALDPLAGTGRQRVDGREVS